MWRPEADGGGFLYHFLPYFLREGPSLSLELTVLARLAQQGGLGILQSLPPQCAEITGTHLSAWLSDGCQGLSLAAGTIPTESSSVLWNSLSNETPRGEAGLPLTPSRCI